MDMLHETLRMNGVVEVHIQAGEAALLPPGSTILLYEIDPEITSGAIVWYLPKARNAHIPL
jgi:hypothetical protein